MSSREVPASKRSKLWGSRQPAGSDASASSAADSGSNRNEIELDESKNGDHDEGEQQNANTNNNGSSSSINSTASGPEDSEDTDAAERRGIEVPEIDLEGLVAEVNSDRKRLSIMKSNHQDPRRLRAGLRAYPQPPATLISSPEQYGLADPGEDIGNGAFGENGASEELGLSFSCVTRPGNDPAKGQKENQDTYCVMNGLASDSAAFSVMVFDGHGPFGALASKFVRERLPKALLDLGIGRTTCHHEEDIRRILHNGCVEVNHRLATSHIDVYVSGTTGVMGVIKKNKLYVANVGDSRAVLGRIGPNGSLQAVDLSFDQKPDRPDEHARIIRYGGRVFEWGVPRVWQRDVDMPGLAMARSFGDLAAEAVGVFAEPEITVTELTKDDKFLIFATDGVWEFMSSSDVIKIIGKHVDNKPPGLAARDACVEVIKTSVARWNEVEDVVDDSTCVIISLAGDDDANAENEL